MRKRVYIVDLIGIHSGMHYYHEAFCSQFIDQDDLDIIVLSNYKSGFSRKFFPYLYSGSLSVKIIKLVYSWFKLAFFLLFNRNGFIVYEFFGRRIDLPFLSLQKLAKNRFIVDVHDLYDISSSDSEAKNRLERKVKQLSMLILHSEKVEAQLANLEYRGKTIMVPHFHYLKNASSTIASEEIKALFRNDKLNLLFFGHIRESKGIKELITILNNISNDDVLNRIHFVVAGNDSDGLLKKLPLPETVSHALLLRKVTDEELDQIFTLSDCVVLPYTKISQSGVLEMAVRYRKPVLCSNLDFFKSYLTHYQSFGLSFDLKDQHSFESAISQLAEQSSSFYHEKDIQNYENDDRFDTFKKDFNALLQL